VAREGVRLISEDVQNNHDERAEFVRSMGVQAYACHPLRAGNKTIGTLSFGTKKRKKFTGDELNFMRTVADQVSVAIERSWAERDLMDYSRQLERSNAELQQFAYVASHDLQEPLRMVTAHLALLNRKFGDELSPQAKEYMSTAVAGAERMRQLVNDLLQYSRVDTKGWEFTSVDMNKVSGAVVGDLQVAIHESGADVSIGILPTVLADEIQMKQVITNLVSNAVKFRGPSPPKVNISATEDASNWTFAIKDNGIGIDPCYRNNLFKMFQRLHSRDEYPGNGIGLAICKKIVERHGGRIWVESEKGNGATFFFTIPNDSLARFRQYRPM
jgi:light-regulated signal transduction histidine kinase (bacteriophytochrome)